MYRRQHGQCELTLTPLSTTPDHIDEDAMHTNEMFIMLFYDRTSTAADIDEARSKLFATWSSTSDKQYTRADMSESGTNIAITDRLGLDQDQQHV